MSEWQPIATAPKDGQPVLVWAHLDWKDNLVPVVAWFSAVHKQWVSHAAWLNPTHWQPLPAPPKVGSDE